VSRFLPSLDTNWHRSLPNQCGTINELIVNFTDEVQFTSYQILRAAICGVIFSMAVPGNSIKRVTYPRYTSDWPNSAWMDQIVPRRSANHMAFPYQWL